MKTGGIRYGFLTLGALSNPGYIRARELGRALLDRRVQVCYVANDTPENRAAAIDPRAEVRLVAHARSLRQFHERRRAIRDLRLDFIEVFPDVNGRSWLTMAGLRGPRMVGFWDEPGTLKQFGWLRHVFVCAMDRWLRRRADLRIVSTCAHQRLWRERYGLEAFYMPFACYLHDYPDGPSPFDRPTVVYMGAFYQWDQDLIFDALVLLARDGIRPPVLLMGTGPDLPKWQAFVREHGLDQVTFAGFTPDEAMFQRLRHAHVLLFPIRPTLLNQTRCPSKTFAYAQARRPVITCRVGEVAAVLGDQATYVDATPQGFAGAIRAAMSAPPARDIDYGMERHTWALRADGLLAELDRGTGPCWK